MAAQWQRWLKYAKAKLDSSLQQGEAELDRREADLEARSAGQPWLSSSSDAPTFDEARARIEHQTRQVEEARGRSPSRSGPDPRPAAEADPSASGAPPRSTGSDSTTESFDMAAHQRAADERLAAIRDELGLGGDEKDPAPPGG